MMNPIWLYPLSFLFLFITIKNKRKRLVYTTIVIMYLLSAISSLYLFYNVPEFMKKPVYWDAVIYHLIFTFLLLAPVKKIDEIKSVSIPRIKNTNFFHLFTMVVIVLCLMSIKLAWQNIDFAAVFNEANSLRVFERESGTLEAYIRFFGTRYYSLALVLAFYYILHEPHKKTLIILLFVCSLSSVISGMQVAAREYLIKYIYLAGVLFLICKNGISKSWNRRIVIMGSIVAFLGIAMFMFISISRFDGLFVKVLWNGVCKLLGAISCVFYSCEGCW